MRLIEDAERARFDLEQKHDLCSARMVGCTLRYVAGLDGEWVALACFRAVALHLKGREKWIGWSARQRGHLPQSQGTEGFPGADVIDDSARRYA